MHFMEDISSDWIVIQKMGVKVRRAGGTGFVPELGSSLIFSEGLHQANNHPVLKTSKLEPVHRILWGEATVAPRVLQCLWHLRQAKFATGTPNAKGQSSV